MSRFIHSRCEVLLGVVLILIAMCDRCLQADAQVIAVPDSVERIAVWDENGKDGLAHWYSVSLDGQTFSRARQSKYEVNLRYAQFDPLKAEPIVVPHLAAPPLHPKKPSQDGLYLVQFFSPPLEVFHEQIESLGGDVHTFMADHSNVVRMSAEVRDQVAALPYVRWVGPYHPAYKLEDSLLGEFIVESPLIPARRYSVMMFERGPKPQLLVVKQIEKLGGEVHLTIPQGFRIEATLTADQIRDIIFMNEVQFVERWWEAEPDMNVARQIGGAVPTLSTAGFTGQGVRGEVLDIGCRITHFAFQDPSPLLHDSFGVDPTHGTQTYGIVFGNGEFNLSGTGMLPDREQGIFASTTTLGNRYQHTLELVSPIGDFRGVFQSNSWGNGLTPSYTAISSELDDIIFLFDVLICQSQSNDGTQLSRPQAWAKNIVSVGGVTHGDTLDRTNDRWTGASFGPAEDGRIKPDLTHFYDSVLCPTYVSDISYTTGFNGTSAATPIVAGHFGLVFQMWHEELFECFGGEATVFESRSHAATAKALVINSAFKYDWKSGGANANLTRARQGWGMPDLDKLYGDRDELFIVDETDLLEPFGMNQYAIEVSGGASEFRATLVYADPRGNPGATVHRINDLSLKVIAPDGTTYWGNSGLELDNESTSGGTSNTVDTVENVFLNGPDAGVWTVQVIGDEIVEDSHTETEDLDADYALVVTGNQFEKLGDVNRDGSVNVDDLSIVVINWGPCPVGFDECNPCPGDEDGNDVVNVNDLRIVILNWS